MAAMTSYAVACRDCTTVLVQLQGRSRRVFPWYFANQVLDAAPELIYANFPLATL